ncbi:transthyretin-like family domain-containing protein [Ditylenchus destructor]|uniref:Transthyretin-like family domain-containing protein n=1 Tax=Ditylenchus destructor TaxID=166010 RepID=A0AAD4MEP4_9BILA|nr:transthyretin-like family domain-containing protein [Ditylenchus destructor]
MFFALFVFVFFAASAAVSNVDVQESLLGVEKSVYVSGRLICGGKPYDGGNVTIYMDGGEGHPSWDPHFGTIMGAARTQQNGEFSFGGVVDRTDGEIYVVFFHQCLRRPSCVSHAAEVPYTLWYLPSAYICPGAECLHDPSKHYKIGDVNLDPIAKDVVQQEWCIKATVYF